jgi:hypothetical protein
MNPASNDQDHGDEERFRLLVETGIVDDLAVETAHDFKEVNTVQHAARNSQTAAI